MSRFKVGLMSLLTVGLLAACASRDTINAKDVNEETLFRNFEVNYDEGTKELAIYAEARVGGDTGTTVRLDADKTPLVDGEKMKICDNKDAKCPDSGIFRFDSGTYYYLTKKTGSPKETYEITWTLRSGLQQTIQLPLAAAVGPAEKNERAWDGAPNREKESVRMLHKDFILRSYHDIKVPQEPGVPFKIADLIRSMPPEHQEEVVDYCFIRELRGVPQDEKGPINGSYASNYKGDWEKLVIGNP